jgi:acetyltransferase-like isoleucine patch superfamily enzyme
MERVHKGKGFIWTIKQVYWELSRPNDRFDYIQFFLGEIPGYLGLLWRMKVYSRRFKSAGKNLTVYQGVRIRNIQEMCVGNDVYLGLENNFQAKGGLTIGDRVAFGPGCKIWTINHRFDDIDTPVMEQGYDYKPVVIGDDVWLGSNVFVMPGVEIPKGCIVTAGTVVGVRKYPEYSIISGNPGRVIGNRKKEKDVSAPVSEVHSGEENAP